MHDLGTVRASIEAFARGLGRRGIQLDVEGFRALDDRRRGLIAEAERKKSERNRLSEEVGKRKRAGEETSEQQAFVRRLADEIAILDEQAAAVDAEFRELLAAIPNIPHESVPDGKSAEDNVEVRREGAPRAFEFPPKPHWDLGPELGILDFDRAAKIAGARFAVYLGLGARLERALIDFMLDTHTREHGYTEVLPPFVINSASLYGTGQLPKFAGDLFKLADTDYWLAPTAEVPVTNLLRDETVDADALPLKLCAYTPCFRSEAGSYGRDTRGIIRQHQFQKVELVQFARPDRSYDELEKLTHDAETILRKLELPFRTVVLSTGDMGFASAKTYDIEVWLPGLGEFKEISSCSNFEAFQARRASIRMKTGKKSEFLHTLNGSGLAIGRTWVAIVENYQQADGSVTVPAALRRYLDAERITPAGKLI